MNWNRRYCSICKKDRNGKLCGCAFPCALTFRAQMLSKIHELLGIDRPQDRRAIQVRSTADSQYVVQEIYVDWKFKW